MHLYVSVYVSTCVCMCVYMCLYVCACVCMCLHMSVCVDMYLYMGYISQTGGILTDRSRRGFRQKWEKEWLAWNGDRKCTTNKPFNWALAKGFDIFITSWSLFWKGITSNRLIWIFPHVLILFLLLPKLLRFDTCDRVEQDTEKKSKHLLLSFMQSFDHKIASHIHELRHSSTCYCEKFFYMNNSKTVLVLLLHYFEYNT